MSEVDNAGPDVKLRRLALVEADGTDDVPGDGPDAGHGGEALAAGADDADGARPPLSVVTATVALVVHLAYTLLVVGVIAVALLSLGMKLGAGLPGHDPVVLQDAVEPSVVLLVVAGLVGLVVVAVAAWLLLAFVRGVWRGRPKRSLAALVLFALTTFTNLSAVQAEGFIPIRVLGAVIAPVGLVLLLLPSAWRWRSRARWRRIAADREQTDADLAQDVP